MSDELLRDLDHARAAFLDALANVDAGLVLVPGAMGDWSVRDLVVHVAAWARHGADAVELAATGRRDEFSYSTSETDAMNERFLAEGRSVSPDEALSAEEAAFGRLRAAVESLDTNLLRLSLGNGDTVEEVIRYDGPEHYAEHTAHLHAWFAAEDDDDAEEG